MPQFQGDVRPLRADGPWSRAARATQTPTRAGEHPPSPVPCPSGGAHRRTAWHRHPSWSTTAEAPPAGRAPPLGVAGSRRRAHPQRRRGPSPARRGAGSSVEDRRHGNGRPRRTYRPGSTGRPRAGAAPRDPSNVPVGTSQRRQPSCALPGDEGLETGADDGGLLTEAAQLGRSAQQSVVNVQGRSHMYQYASSMHMPQVGPPTVRALYDPSSC